MLVIVRAPFQVLIFPYTRAADGTLRYAVFRRANLGVWQGLAGGGEDGETPAQAARRETAEEAGGVPADAAWVRCGGCPRWRSATGRIGPRTWPKCPSTRSGWWSRRTPWYSPLSTGRHRLAFTPRAGDDIESIYR